MSLAQARKQEEEKEEKNRKLISGFITFGMLVALVAVMLFFGFTYLDPPPEEQGVMVSLGQPDGGTFDDENQSTPEQTASSTPQTEESFETQDIEPAPEETVTPPVQTQPKPITPTERPKPEPPKPQADPNLNFNQSNTTPKNQGEGDKPAPGGDPTGQQGGTPGGTGIGTSGNGGDYRMGLGRKPEGKINASCNFTSNEVVVVKIKVDQNGYVKEAECVLKYKDLYATTVGEPYCKCAKQAAKSAKFTAKSDAPTTQEGAVKFDFRVK